MKVGKKQTNLIKIHMFCNFLLQKKQSVKNMIVMMFFLNVMQKYFYICGFFFKQSFLLQKLNKYKSCDVQFKKKVTLKSQALKRLE